MSNYEDIPNAVQWSEGMLLSPHHFQQQQIYLEKRLCHQLKINSPYYWGINELEINHNDLNNERLTIEKVNGIMPDGSIINYAQSPVSDGNMYNPAPLEINLSTQLSENNHKGMIIYLAIPLRHGAAASTQAERKRYDSISEKNVIDENTGVNAISIERLKPKFELLSKIEAGYSCLPLLKVIRTQSGKVALAPFYPPMLRLAGKTWLDGDSLWLKVDLVMRIVRDKAEGLALKSGNDNRQNNDRQKIQTLVSGLLPLETMLLTDHCHPWEVYLGLSSLLANISILDQQPIPAPLDKYQHNNLYSCFTSTLNRIKRILADIQWRYETIILDSTNEGHFTTQLNEDWSYQSALYLELKAMPGKTIEQLMEWIKNCRIGCTDEKLNQLQRVRGRGAKRILVNSFKDINIRRKSDALFLKIPIKSQEEFIQFGKQLWIISADSKTQSFMPSKVVMHVPGRQVISQAKDTESNVSQDEVGNGAQN